MEDLMSKPAKKRSLARSTSSIPSKPSKRVTIHAKPEKADAGTKQSRVLAMLRSPAGATLAAMMEATDWQQHSVRGFLAGVVRKRLKMKLESKKVDGNRVYQISGDSTTKSVTTNQPKSRAA
jgi:Protein of unknown function (DUF3489)